MRHYTKNLKKRKITRKKNKRNRSKKRGGATSGGGAEMLVDATPSASDGGAKMQVDVTPSASDGSAKMQVDVTPSAAAGAAVAFPPGALHFPPFPLGAGGAAPPFPLGAAVAFPPSALHFPPSALHFPPSALHFPPGSGGAAPPFPPSASAGGAADSVPLQREQKYISMNSELRRYILYLQNEKGVDLTDAYIVLNLFGIHAHGNEFEQSRVRPGKIFKHIGTVPSHGTIIISGIGCRPKEALICAFNSKSSTSLNMKTLNKFGSDGVYEEKAFLRRNPKFTGIYGKGCSEDFGWHLGFDPPPPNRAFTFGEPKYKKGFYGMFTYGTIVPLKRNGTPMSAQEILGILTKNPNTPQFKRLYDGMTAKKNILKDLMKKSENDGEPYTTTLELVLVHGSDDANKKKEEVSKHLRISKPNLYCFDIFLVQSCRGTEDPTNNTGNGSQGNAWLERHAERNAERAEERNAQNRTDIRYAIAEDEPPLTPEPHGMSP